MFLTPQALAAEDETAGAGLPQEAGGMTPPLSSSNRGPVGAAWLPMVALGFVIATWTFVWLIAARRVSAEMLIPLFAGLGFVFLLGALTHDRQPDAASGGGPPHGLTVSRPVVVSAPVLPRRRIDHPRATASRVRRPHSRLR